MKAIFLCDSEINVRRVFGEAQYALLKKLVDIEPRVYGLASAPDAELIFSTWGMPRANKAEIAARFPSLKAVFYAAGTVQDFARPFLEKGVRVFSAWRANAVPVAEFTLAQILLAAKGYFLSTRLITRSRAEASAFSRMFPGMYDIKIGLLGLGAVGAAVARLLKGFDCEVWAFDPFASDEKLAELGARRATMDEIFAECDIVSNHLANLPATRGIITRNHFMSMRDNSTFINTGRGPQLDERDLEDMLREKPAVTALLDVMTDERLSDEKPLARMPNCFISPHIAGSNGNEVRRMADYMISEFERFIAGEPSVHEVTIGMLETMA